MSYSIAAIVPMRHDSERVAGKNYRLFACKPLYHHVITNLLQSPLINTVVIDTDSPFVISDAAEHFPQVKILERPVHLRAGSIPMNDVLLNTINQISADFYLQTHSTNPLLSTDSINLAISKFLASYPLNDSLFTVTRIQSRLWDGLARAINHNPAMLIRTQDLPPVYEENSCMYIFDRATLEARHNRIGARPIMYEIDRFEACDIDEETDFRLAEQLFLINQSGKSHDL
jgi:CMP-N-acetylneuraminic acid synthetase